MMWWNDVWALRWWSSFWLERCTRFDYLLKITTTKRHKLPPKPPFPSCTVCFGLGLGEEMFFLTVYFVYTLYLWFKCCFVCWDQTVVNKLYKQASNSRLSRWMVLSVYGEGSWPNPVLPSLFLVPPTAQEDLTLCFAQMQVSQCKPQHITTASGLCRKIISWRGNLCDLILKALLIEDPSQGQHSFQFVISCVKAV